MIYLLFLLAVAGLIGYINRASILVWYHNWRAKAAAEQANSAAASGDEIGRLGALRVQRDHEIKAAVAADESGTTKPTVSGETRK